MKPEEAVAKLEALYREVKDGDGSS